MHRSLLIVLLYALAPQGLSAQRDPALVSGPILGQVEMRTASLWIEVKPTVRSVSLRCWKPESPSVVHTEKFDGPLQQHFNPVTVSIGGLEPGTTYSYQFYVDNRPASPPYRFTTKPLWQWRGPAPDFTFLTGSCAYFNEVVYDRPGKPYGGDSTIFRAMANIPAAFMLWLGDNWYTREADYFSTWGLWYRASRDRSLDILQPFWRAMPHYATWDDHDFGPDNSNSTYELKDSSRALFLKYWMNPSYGENGQGIYTKLSYSDVDFFLTDDRYFRSPDELPDSVQGHPNPGKVFFGKQQMTWLKNSLAGSQATFKVIVVGSQVLNPIHEDFECLHHYPAEFEELMQFLDEQKLEGVIFLTGDRHHSEIIKTDRPSAYTLYDITSSPLTSGIARVHGIEVNSPFRLPGTLIEQQSFAKIAVTGPTGQRRMTVQFLGLHGEKLAEWSIDAASLKYPAR